MEEEASAEWSCSPPASHLSSVAGNSAMLSGFDLWVSARQMRTKNPPHKARSIGRDTPGRFHPFELKNHVRSLFYFCDNERIYAFYFMALRICLGYFCS
ncbi:hypothetical protein CDAR_60261 [Caerostris darwini]|uniref:Uncharacterized protein n=1 Tax=Caerostris darwini TaxID=1538125 RepID=A0AAV4QNH1_9ARAC|nr:hypothetical protein CDAR_60261 [Caerostris darwini]